MIQDLKRMFRKLTPLEMASSELADAELLLLEAHSGVEFALSQVEYNSSRVKRLREYIANQTTQ